MSFFIVLFLAISFMCTAIQGGTIQNNEQHLLALEITLVFGEIPGNSIVKLCPESRETDILKIKKIVNRPKPTLDEEIDVFIWVDYQIDITANTGDFGALNGTFQICDCIEQMRQAPDWNITKSCPPSKGAVFIDYAWWFADWLVAPGNWSVKFDAKTPEGERIYCLQTKFDLQCPPEKENYGCLRNLTDTLNIPWMKNN
ncbi:hypothetical protein BTUL_0154g00080 [Botrytis tulipae]|uniref:Phosphatidylglycerol/phosphatidylinositol transfer protein n=1 Tax=Botrytis tulipae TaxID=87230 RepID=A0A4Z1EC27_9HELO|nr:hypothetical protein BTUL_0154g00080 [Botrytis tulipae]